VLNKELAFIQHTHFELCGDKVARPISIGAELKKQLCLFFEESEDYRISMKKQEKMLGCTPCSNYCSVKMGSYI
jgi:hypothetical protein